MTYTNIGNKSYLENGVGSNSKIEDRKTRWALAFYSFNPIVNLEKLFTVKQGGDQSLAVFNGVRVLSICWVVVGHGFSLVNLAPVRNIQTVSDMVKDPTFSLVPGGFFAVDSFFYLAGFLTFYLLTAKLYPKKGKIGILNTFLIYFHRYYRLFFPLLFVQLVATYLMVYFGDGPFYR